MTTAAPLPPTYNTLEQVCASATDAADFSAAAAMIITATVAERRGQDKGQARPYKGAPSIISSDGMDEAGTLQTSAPGKHRGTGATGAAQATFPPAAGDAGRSPTFLAGLDLPLSGTGWRLAPSYELSLSGLCMLAFWTRVIAALCLWYGAIDTPRPSVHLCFR